MIRLFDSTYNLDDLRNEEIDLNIKGRDGFLLEGKSSMKNISRDVLELVNQTINENHQYPDGLVLFTGTGFAPVKDRDIKNEGFTHKVSSNI
jgi:fumarylacetoacetate (FAA) hydrolase family protein